jgi:hypothetical protein
MRRANAILLLMLLAATASCRGVPFAPFSRPLPTDVLATEEQLKFVCDFPLPPDHRLIRELQSERNDIYTTLGLPPSEEQIFVHLFHDADTYHEHLARKFPMVPNRRAFFVETDTKLHVYAHWSDRVAEDLRHEVGHGYLHASVPAIPLWIDEGLAEYFEVPRGHGGLNRPHLLLLADLMEVNGWHPDLHKLEALSSAGEMQQEHYAEAWAWVYFLLNSTPDRRELLTEYLTELRETGRAAPLSERLASRHIEPQRTLAEFLVTLIAQQPAN